MFPGKFTIWHGFAASLAVHSALALPFVVHNLESPSEEMPTLVIELQGAVADNQTEQKVLQQVKGTESQQEEVREAPPAAPPPPVEPPKEVAEKADDPAPSEQKPAEAAPQTPPPQQATPLTPGTTHVPGAEETQAAQTIRTDRDLEADRLREYVKVLTKKVQGHLVYPEEGRRSGWQGNATVSFTVATSGQVRSDTLRIVESSGQPKLDASALATVQASSPFEPPPKEITLTIVVGFGRKR